MPRGTARKCQLAVAGQLPRISSAQIDARKGIEALCPAASAAALATRQLPIVGEGIGRPEERGHLALCPDQEMLFRDERHSLVALATKGASRRRGREGCECK